MLLRGPASPRVVRLRCTELGGLMDLENKADVRMMQASAQPTPEKNWRGDEGCG